MELRNDGVGPDNLPLWYRQALDALDFPLSWPKAAARGETTEEWVESARKVWYEHLLPEIGPPTPSNGGIFLPSGELVFEEDRQTYVFQEWDLVFAPFRKTRGWVTLPQGPGPFPGVLLLHDHGARFDIGKEKMIRPPTNSPSFPSAYEWVQKNYGGQWVSEGLARRGWASLSIDALGWGDRTIGTYENQQGLASNLLNLGTSWAGVIACEDISSALWLSCQPWIDSEKVVALGHSMGGFRASQVTSLSPSIRGGIGVCFASTLQASIAPGANRTRGQSAFAMTHPGLSRYLDFPDLIALAFPKPILLIHGDGDSLCPLPGLTSAVSRVQTVYEDRLPSSFTSHIRSGGHAFPLADQEMAGNWLNANFGS